MAGGIPAAADTSVVTSAAQRDLEQLLARILDAVERGELKADTPRAIALLRRLEGARAALEATRVRKRKAARKPATQRRARPGS